MSILWSVNRPYKIYKPISEVTFQGHHTIKLQHLGEVETSLPQNYFITLTLHNKFPHFVEVYSEEVAIDHIFVGVTVSHDIMVLRISVTVVIFCLLVLVLSKRLVEVRGV